MSDKICQLKYQTQCSQIFLPQTLDNLKQTIQQKFNISVFNLNYIDGDDILNLDYDDEYEVLYKLGLQNVTILIQTKQQEENRLFKQLQMIYEQNKKIKITNYTELFRLHLDLLEREQKQLLDYSVCVPSDIKKVCIQKKKDKYDAYYKVHTQKQSYSPGTMIQQVIELQNIGYEQWPSITLMVLTENNIKLEFNLLNLKPEQSQTITIKFECPQQEGSHRYIFRLQGFIDGQLSFFGPRISIEFISKFSSLEDKRKYIHNYIDHTLPKQECQYFKLVIDSKLECNPDMTVSTALSFFVNFEQQKRQIEAHNKFSELLSWIQKRFNINQIKLQYVDNDDLIELDDDEDYAMLKKNPNDRIQIKVTAKNFDQQQQQGFITFKDLPGSTSQILERDFKYQQSFFPDDQVVCCKNTNCQLCKGNYIIYFDEKQKQKVNDLVRQRLTAKLNAIKNRILIEKGINIQSVDDFIELHSQEVEQQNGRKSKNFNKKPALPLVNLNTIGNAPFISNDITPGNSSQAITSGVFFNPQSQLQIPTPQGGSQAIQKSSLAKQSQILKNPQSSIRTKNVVLPSINLNEDDEQAVERQYDAIYSENKEKIFKPGNKKNYLTITLQNSGTITWPPDIMLQQVETDSKYPIQINILPFSPEDKRDITIPIPEELNERTVILKFKLRCTINGREQYFGPIITCQYSIKYDSFEEKVQTYANKTLAVLGGTKYIVLDQVKEFLKKKYELTIDEVISQILTLRNEQEVQLSDKID